MPEDIKEQLRLQFEKGEYDFFPDSVENDVLIVNLSNYKEISIELINILNSVRNDRFIDEQEKFYAKEEIFADNYFETMYNAIKRHENLEELNEEVLEDLKKYYHLIKSITLVGITYVEEDDEYKNVK